MIGILDDLIQLIRTVTTVIITPPVGFLWLAILGLAIPPGRQRRRPGGLLLVLGLVGLYASSMPVVSHALLSGLEGPRNLPATEDAPTPGAIIVLGGDARLTLDAPGAEPGSISTERLVGAARLVRNTGLPVLITGGSTGRALPPIADLMAASFDRDFGLPVKWHEERSESTCENAAFSAAILRDSGIQSAWVVTHSWHMRRALLSFERAGYLVRPAPLPADKYEFKSAYDLLPSITAWVRTYHAIHEWVGLLAYRIGACPRSHP